MRYFLAAFLCLTLLACEFDEKYPVIKCVDGYVHKRQTGPDYYQRTDEVIYYVTSRPCLVERELKPEE